jgi:heme oxygenase
VDDLHLSVERRLDLLADPLDPGRYADALVVLERVLGPLEIIVADDGVWPATRLAPLLVADIGDLGRVPELPVVPDDLDTEAACWGARYVIEGSRLGAAVVERHLAAVLGWAPRRYFSAAANDVGPRWTRFRAAAGGALARDDDVEEAIRAARSVFAALLVAGGCTDVDRGATPVGSTT